MATDYWCGECLSDGCDHALEAQAIADKEKAAGNVVSINSRKKVRK